MVWEGHAGGHESGNDRERSVEFSRTIPDESVNTTIVW
jgi:hypothetical protein